jgi:probable F420-dependent oxidoreductase
VTRPFRFGVNLAEIPAGSSVGEQARAFEDMGYAVLSCPDHLNHPDSPLDPMLVLAAAAEATTDIQFQPLVLANDFRHPALLAKQSATLDHLSGGRFALGLGAGWYGPDFSATGVGLRPPAQRIARLREAVEIIRGLHRGEPFTFEGEHYTLREVIGAPVPVRHPMPLLIGGSGPRILALAAETADTVALNLGLPMGWPRPETATPYADITDRKLNWLRESAGQRLATLEVQTSVFTAALSNRNPHDLLAPLADMLKVPASALDDCPHVLCGSQAQCIDTLQSWRERWGISYVTFSAPMAREFAPVVAALRGN